MYVRGLLVRMFGDSDRADRWFERIIWLLWLVLPLDIFVIVNITGDELSLLEALSLLCVKVSCIIAAGLLWTLVTAQYGKVGNSIRHVAATDFSMAAICVWALMLLPMSVSVLTALSPVFTSAFGTGSGLPREWLLVVTGWDAKSSLWDSFFYQSWWLGGMLVVAGLVLLVRWRSQRQMANSADQGESASRVQDFTFWLIVCLVVLCMQGFSFKLAKLLSGM